MGLVIKVNTNAPIQAFIDHINAGHKVILRWLEPMEVGQVFDLRGHPCSVVRLSTYDEWLANAPEWYHPSESDKNWLYFVEVSFD